LRVYLKRGRIKAEVAVARGKKEWDKRETIRRREADMEAKRAVRRVRKVGNADIFEPLIAKDAARDTLLDEILSFFGGRPQPMMAQLVESGKLTLDEIREFERAAVEAQKRSKADKTRKSK